MTFPVIHNRGGPVQTAHPGLFTCSQSICSDAGCVDNSLQFECISQVKQGYDISFLGLTMECDGDKSEYPYLACTCIEDFVNCNDNGALQGQGSPNAVAQTATLRPRRWLERKQGWWIHRLRRVSLVRRVPPISLDGRSSLGLSLLQRPRWSFEDF